MLSFNHSGKRNLLLLSVPKAYLFEENARWSRLTYDEVDLPRNQATSLHRFRIANGNSAKDEKFTNGARGSRRHRNILNSW